MAERTKYILAVEKNLWESKLFAQDYSLDFLSPSAVNQLAKEVGTEKKIIYDTEMESRLEELSRDRAAFNQIIKTLYKLAEHPQSENL